MLSKLQLLETILRDGNQVIISELRLSYYSGPKQLEVKRLVEMGMLHMHDHPDNLFSFIEEYTDVFPCAGEGILILIHLCKTSDCTLVIEDDQEMVKDIARFFNIPILSTKEFYKQKIKNQQYLDFLIEQYNG